MKRPHPIENRDTPQTIHNPRNDAKCAGCGRHHSQYVRLERCAQCGAHLCSVCVYYGAGGRDLCGHCLAKEQDGAK